MAARRGLNKGRGLGSLIPPKEPETETPAVSGKTEEAESAAAPADTKSKTAASPAKTPEKTRTEDNVKDAVIAVRLSQVVPNQQQPRKNFEEGSLEKLADSIRQFGVLQPLLVKKKGRYYEIIAGERRWRAARLVGLREIPVIVREYEAQDAAAISLIENIQREDLNPIEEAQAYRRLIDEYGLTQEEAAQRVSKSRTAVTNSLRLLRLNEQVQEMVIRGELSMGHARALLVLDDAAAQNEAAEQIVRKGLSVRDTEKLVKKLIREEEQPAVGKGRADTQLETSVRRLEAELMQSLGTQVTIRTSGREKGKIEISYYSLQDLDRLTGIIRGGEST